MRLFLLEMARARFADVSIFARRDGAFTVMHAISRQKGHIESIKTDTLTVHNNDLLQSGSCILRANWPAW